MRSGTRIAVAVVAVTVFWLGQRAPVWAQEDTGIEDTEQEWTAFQTMEGDSVALLPSTRPLQFSDRLAVTGTQRVALGVDSVSDLALWLTGAGADLRLAHTLTLRGLLLGMITIGEPEAGAAADRGLGGELSLRLSPWPDWRIRPYLWWGIGLIFFREPFLPGGTRYDGIISFGVGADWPLSRRLSLGASVYTVHLSNGQGLGAHNPAYDGFGASLSLSWFLRPAGHSGHWPRPKPADQEQPRSGQLGATLESNMGKLDQDTLITGRALLAARLHRAWLVRVDAESGILADEWFTEVGAALVARHAWASLGVRAAHSWFVGIRTVAVTVQPEVHLSPAVTLAAMGHYADSGDLGDVLRAGFGLRTFPLDDLMVELGIGFDHIGDNPIDGSDPYLGIEWRVPWLPRPWQLSFYLERQISTIDIMGLRFGYHDIGTLRERDRRADWRPIR